MKSAAANLVTLSIVIATLSLSAAQGPPNDTSISLIYRENVGKVVQVNTFRKDNTPLSQGSGFIVGSDGKILTNQHVIADANTIQIKMATGAFYSVLGVSAVDCDSDLALLDLSASGIEFPFVELADTATVVIGDPVLAIGSPLSLEGSLSEGIISGIRTPASGNERYFQTTTPVSSGNSGGP